MRNKQPCLKQRHGSSLAGCRSQTNAMLKPTGSPHSATFNKLVCCGNVNGVETRSRTVSTHWIAHRDRESNFRVSAGKKGDNLSQAPHFVILYTFTVSGMLRFDDARDHLLGLITCPGPPP